MTGPEIRRRFLTYFGERSHVVVRSSPLVPLNDPTLLFTNAGMVQFKSVFLGEEKREYARAASCQKCVRAGGKHNDLENVGRTVRHHTFFEMLGNFSFGDYFKSEAIAYAWEFLTRDLGLPKDRLKATVFTEDDDAYAIWRKVAGFGDDRILRLGEKDNFWAMGETGPCGPCSEIHFHQGDHLACSLEREGRRCLGPACDCDRWIEVWNLVFMQYNRDAEGTLTPLPRPSIDTGMGLERVTAVLLGKPSNYETDLIRPLVAHVERLTRKRYGVHEEEDVSMRVIADHARAAAFLIADGVNPGNEWRGYVLRRIMRRAMRHGRTLGLVEPFLFEISQSVVGTMGDAYPELLEHAPRVAETVRTEEERFAETLDLGMAKIRDYMEAEPRRGRVVDGKFLFTLYDTHGFPVDLAQEVFADAGWSVPEASLRAFEEEMEAQRERARMGGAFDAGAVYGDPARVEVYRQLQTALPRPQFLGYSQLAAPARILAMVVSGARKREAYEGNEVEIILDRTPAYAESGGQMGDTGGLVGRDGQGEILDTFYRGAQLIVHRVRVTRGTLKEGDEVAVSVEPGRRHGLKLHHTGTHLLHAALRKILGAHVAQAGSLVAPDHLRFDFSHSSPVKDREILEVEEMVNEKVQENIGVSPREMELKVALEEGALALFGEKYGEKVRVVRIGDFSTELCGGTHLNATGEIGLFKILSETAVASGVRRIEAVTGEAARRHVGEEERALREAAGLLKIPPLELPRRLEKLLEEQNQREKRLAELEARQTRGRAQEISRSARKVAGVHVVAARVDGLDQEGLRALADSVRAELRSALVCLGGVRDGRVVLVAAVTKDLTGKLHAGKLIQELASVVGGSGGGRPDLAQAGGKDPAKLDQALAIVFDWVARLAEGRASP